MYMYIQYMYTHVHVQCTLYVCVGMLYIIVSFVACMCTCAFTTVYSHSSNMYLPLLLSCPYWRPFPFHLYTLYTCTCTVYVAYVPCVHEKCMYMYMYKLISSLSPHSRKFPNLVHMCTCLHSSLSPPLQVWWVTHSLLMGRGHST